MDLQEKMFQQMKQKDLFEQAREYAYRYADQIESMDVFPSTEKINALQSFDEAIPEHPTSGKEILKQLNDIGGPATIAQTGGRYFGFVDGGAVPISIATKWLTDFWDQCGGLYLTSPVNAKLEAVCEAWLKDVFDLPNETVAGFVSGTSMANLCGLAAARFRLLKNQGWDVNSQGLSGAPKIRVIAHDQVHSSIKKTLALLGLGTANVEWLPSLPDGTLDPSTLPSLDDSCLVLLQAGNVNSGAYDPFDEVCELAQKAKAWVHIDGAFGLWARACKDLKYLTKGMEKAHSWAVDGHKTLNTPYDSGIIMCQDSEALITALQANADYIIFSDARDPLMYTPEMSKRSRAIELWATMKFLGKQGIDEMISGFVKHAQHLSEGLKNVGFSILNDVVFNQVLLTCETDELTRQVLKEVQASGELWCGGSKWHGKEVIRISICSWATTEDDIERTIKIFKKALGN